MSITNANIGSSASSIDHNRLPRNPHDEHLTISMGQFVHTLCHRVGNVTVLLFGLFRWERSSTYTPSFPPSFVPMRKTFNCPFNLQLLHHIQSIGLLQRLWQGGSLPHIYTHRYDTTSWEGPRKEGAGDHRARKTCGIQWGSNNGRGRWPWRTPFSRAACWSSLCTRVFFSLSRRSNNKRRGPLLYNQYS